MSPRSIHTIPSGIIHCSDTYLHHHHHSHARNAIQQKRDNSSDIKQHQAENSIDSVQDRPYQEPEQLSLGVPTLRSPPPTFEKDIGARTLPATNFGVGIFSSSCLDGLCVDQQPSIPTRPKAYIAGKQLSQRLQLFCAESGPLPLASRSRPTVFAIHCCAKRSRIHRSS